MINWEREKREALNTSTRHYENYEVWLMGVGAYSAVIRDNTMGYSARVFSRTSPEPTVTLFAIDLESAKKAAINWIRNDLWNTLGQIGIATDLEPKSCTVWSGAGGAITATASGIGPVTSGTIYLKPNPSGVGWTYTNAQHNP